MESFYPNLKARKIKANANLKSKNDVCLPNSNCELVPQKRGLKTEVSDPQEPQVACSVRVMCSVIVLCYPGVNGRWWDFIIQDLVCEEKVFKFNFEFLMEDFEEKLLLVKYGLSSESQLNWRLFKGAFRVT